ncbi:MAG TPA: ATP-binding protein [Acidimicrobiales bacterium]|nr:ATP-binding protein [Acidimicrobiales bacterium]
MRVRSRLADAEERARRVVLQRPSRRVGRPLQTARGRRGEILAAVYVIGVVGAITAWLADPADISNAIAMAAVLAVAGVGAVILFVFRERLPEWTGDVAIAGSIALISGANLACRLHVHPGLLTAYYIWVGFAAPMWFTRRRAATYVGVSILASGVVALVDDTAVAAAAWLVTVAVLIVAFITVDSLTRALVERERLAALGEMASVVSHELRNPLAVVTNSLFLVRHTLGDSLTAELERHLAVAGREVDKANAIIEHVVAFVRPRRPEVESVALDEVIDEALETTPPPPGVRVDHDRAPVTAVVDRGHLAEVLVNLVSNAYEAMPDGGVLRVNARPGAGAALVVVEDTGRGFDRADAERLFEPFFTTKPTGTGLGLAIVRRLAEVNRGEVTVDMRPGGTRFTVTLPAGKPRTFAGRPGNRMRQGSRDQRPAAPVAETS